MTSPPVRAIAAAEIRRLFNDAALVAESHPTKQLMEALERGGYQHRSKNFYTTVFGVLNRHWKTQGEIVKVDGDWGLREWYRTLAKTRSRFGGLEIETAPPESETKEDSG